jgi:adenylate cyclase
LLAAQIDSCLGNCQDGYSHYKQYIILSNKLKSEEVRKQAIKEKYQSDYDQQKAKDKAEQDKKDAIALKELQKQKIVRNGFIASFLLVLIFAGIFFSQHKRITKEKKRSEKLLLNILPHETAEELKIHGSTKAKQFEEVTVMFTDFKDFTNASEQMSAEDLVKILHFYFGEFDRIISRYHIEKIKTIGDSYMCAGGLPLVNETHAVDVVTAALELQTFMAIQKSERISRNEHWFDLRIGIHTGPVVAGIVGTWKFSYDIWGDTVNIASRMENSGETGKVNISSSTYERIKDNFDCTYRGKVTAKNKGEVDMYFVENIS